MQHQRRWTPLLLALATLAAVVGFLVPASKALAADPPENSANKITFCHHREGRFPYGTQALTVSVSAFLNQGHDSHALDIIPSFQYWDGDTVATFPGKNLNEFGLAVLANDCRVPAPVVKDLSEEKLTCDGLLQRTGTMTTTYDVATMTVTTETVWNDWTTVREATNAEKAQLDCPKPPQPEPVVKQLNDSRTDCSGVFARTGTETTAYVWDAASWSWVLGEAVTSYNDWTKVRDLTEAEKAENKCTTATPTSPTTTPTSPSPTPTSPSPTPTSPSTTPTPPSTTPTPPATTATSTAARPAGPGHSGDTGADLSGAIAVVAGLSALTALAAGFAARRQRD